MKVQDKLAAFSAPRCPWALGTFPTGCGRAGADAAPCALLAGLPSLPPSVTLGLLRVREKSTFSESQRTTLEQAYQCKPYVDYQRRIELAMNIGLSEEQVRIWFQNRRAKDRQVAKRRTEPTDRLYSPKAASGSGTPWWTNSSPKPLLHQLSEGSADEGLCAECLPRHCEPAVPRSSVGPNHRAGQGLVRQQEDPRPEESHHLPKLPPLLGGTAGGQPRPCARPPASITGAPVAEASPWALPRPHYRSVLEAHYKQRGRYVSRETCLQLASRLHLTFRQVQYWFQNRRARDKRKKALRSNAFM
ncbi:uncharacterized protein LOC144158592 [Haemaphysalis longicornis]